MGVGGDDDVAVTSCDEVDKISNLEWCRIWNKSRGVLRLLSEGIVRGTQVMFGEYKLRIREWQLFVGELIPLSPQFARR